MTEPEIIADSSQPTGGARPLGAAYRIALNLRKLLKTQLPPNSHAALATALRSIDERRRDHESESITCERLAGIFDMNSIISFSGAWAYWDDAERLLNAAPGHLPLDQSLFEGKHVGAADYFEGIGRLASISAGAASHWIQESGVRRAAFLDAGAGTGAHGMAFLHAGVASRVVCVDHPYVVHSVAHSTGTGLLWVAADLRRGGEYAAIDSIDALWISNVLHHYSVADCVRILQGCRPFLRKQARVFIHEYCIDTTGNRGLAAGILGLHFALTTNDGRCYSRNELKSMVDEALGNHEICDELALPISTAIMLQRKERQ